MRRENNIHSQCLATEFADQNITFNILSPGRIDTARNPSFYMDPAAMQKVDDIPMARLGKPTEIAKACLYFASEDAAYITGQTLHVNGGRGYYWISDHCNAAERET